MTPERALRTTHHALRPPQTFEHRKGPTISVNMNKDVKTDARASARAAVAAGPDICRTGESEVPE